MLFIVLIPSFLIVYVLVTFTRNYFRLPSSFRGPFLACITDLWLFRQCLAENVHQVEDDLLHENASISGIAPNTARIGPNLLVTNDPDVLRHISLPKSRWTRSSWYDGFEMGGDTKHVFAERDEKRHRDLRAKLGNAYSGKGVDNVESCIDTQTLALLNLLRKEYAQPRKALDMTRIAAFFTLDVLSSIAYGIPFGFLPANKDKWAFIEGTDKFHALLELICVFPFVQMLFKNFLVQSLLSPKETDEEGHGRVWRFAADAIKNRFDGEKGKEDKRDMLGCFKANGLTVEECKSESLIQIIAGTDSTSSTLRSTMLYVMTNPRVYRALQKEVDETVAQGRVKEGFVVPDAVARQLPYLQAVVWEGLRKTPPLFGLISKVAPSEGETINNVYFPGGVELAVCLQSVTHRKDIFGEDAHIFRPERWLDIAPERRTKFERTTELAFGSGRYGCLGRNIAWIELGKVFFELMRHFEWQVVNPLRPVEETHAHGLWVQKGMNMIASVRGED